MSIKDLMFEEWDNLDEDRGHLSNCDLETFAALLGGEVEDRYVRCPSPHRPADDRSCFVRIDGPSNFYIYDCEGPKGRAYANIRNLLKLAPTTSRRDYSPFALRVLNETTSAPGTIVETYLRGRGLTLLPPTLRFHGKLLHTETGYCLPGMVAERTDVNGLATAIHRTFLRHDGNGKATVTPQRKDLGLWRGTGIRLAPVANELMIGEGIETTLSAMQMYGLPGWAAGSAGAMRDLLLPPLVRKIIVLADGDLPGAAASRFASSRWQREGRNVRIASAPAGRDFNDLLLEMSK